MKLIYIGMNYMYSNILSWNIIEKTPSGHVGTRTCVAGLSQQTYAMLYTIMYPQKRNASGPEVSNTVFSHSSNVNSHIMTDAIFAM